MKAFCLAVSGILIGIGTFMLTTQEQRGLVPLLAGMILCILTQRGVFERITTCEALQHPSQLGASIILMIALCVNGYCCFSYIDSLTGIHFDVAEHGLGIREYANSLHRIPMPLWLLILKDPFNTLIAGILKTCGWGVWQLRVAGAMVCFLIMPAGYLFMRLFFNRGAALFSALMLSSSLMTFTLSKLAHFGTPVPFCATVAIFSLVMLMEKRCGWLMLPLLAVILLCGFNLYNSFRLIYPSIGAIIFFYLITRRRGVIRPLFACSAIVLAIFLQRWIVDPQMFMRIKESNMIYETNLNTYKEFAKVFFGKLFFGMYDIDFSPSQGGIDNPIVVSLFILGFAIVLANILSYRGVVIFSWILFPSVISLLFQGQWRRTTAGLTAIYICVSLPFAAWAAYSPQPHPGQRYLLLKRIALIIPFVMAVMLTLFSASRFQAIQTNRAGGYYRSTKEVAAAFFAARNFYEGDIFLFTNKHDLFWNFLGSLIGAETYRFKADLNTFRLSDDNLDVLLGLVDEAAQTPMKLIPIFSESDEWSQKLYERLLTLNPGIPCVVFHYPLPEAEPTYKLFLVSTVWF